MLRNTKQLKGRALHARDGDLGEVKDIYFDDHHWHVRYFAVQTGAWLNKRQVLIAPEALEPLDWNHGTFPTNLTADQVRNSPGIDTAKPVSRQHEEALRVYYGWPAYWDSAFVSGGLAAPIIAPTPAANTAEPGLTDGESPLAKRGDPRLRSVNDTKGYRIDVIDGVIGHVHDFLVDERGWRIRYIVVDTGKWWPGRKVLVAPAWIKHISSSDRSVAVDLTRDAIKGSPPYDESAPWTAGYSAELHDYYRKPRYSDWDGDVTAGAPRLDRDQ